MDQTAKQRFLVAYTELQTVAGACRRAQVHRSTVYRWRADPAFVAAMRAAWRAGHERYLKEVYAPQEQARQAAHEQRNLELRPMRQELAARAREAKQPRGAW